MDDHSINKFLSNELDDIGNNAMGSQDKVLEHSGSYHIYFVIFSCFPTDKWHGPGSNSDVMSSPSVGRPGIPANNFPFDIAVNSFTNMIYVTNPYSNTLTVINGDTDKAEDTVFVGILPYGVDVDLFTNRIYVANHYSNEISVVDGGTNTIVPNITNINSPTGVKVDASDSWIYVTNIDKNTVSKIDAINNTVVKYAKVGKNPYSVEIKGGRDAKIYVTNIGSNSVSVLDKTSFETLKNITVGESPVGLGVILSQIQYM